MMVERIIVLFLLAVAIAAIRGGLGLWRSWKVSRLRVESPLTGIIPAGRPTIVSFSTPTCGECRARQAPALKRLAAKLGDTIAIHSLSALEHPELIERLGILTVPATVVLDAAGMVRQLNLGYTSDAQLSEQLGMFGVMAQS